MNGSQHAHRDLVVADGRLGVYWYDAGQDTTYGSVLFDRPDGGADSLGVPWSAIESTGFWRCGCPRDWKIATAPSLRCNKCGLTRQPAGPAADTGAPDA